MATHDTQPGLPVAALILAASKTELYPVLGALGIRGAEMGYASVVFKNHRIANGATGVGGARAAAAARRLIDQFKPARVVLVGFSGALDPSRRPGQAIQMRHVTHEDGRIIHLDGPTPTTDVARTDIQRAYTALTVDRVVGSPQGKAQLFEKFGVACVDMESFHVARVCQELSVPLTIVRAISDGYDESIPAEAANWIDDRGSVRTTAVLGYLLRHPGELSTLKRLQKSSKRAGAQLGAAVKQLLAPLLPAKCSTLF